MKYRKILCALLAALMLATVGCTGQEEAAPDSTVPGYYSMQTLSGGRDDFISVGCARCRCTNAADCGN